MDGCLPVEGVSSVLSNNSPPHLGIIIDQLANAVATRLHPLIRSIVQPIANMFNGLQEWRLGTGDCVSLAGDEWRGPRQRATIRISASRAWAALGI